MVESEPWVGQSLMNVHTLSEQTFISVNMDNDAPCLWQAHPALSVQKAGVE